MADNDQALDVANLPDLGDRPDGPDWSDDQYGELDDALMGNGELPDWFIKGDQPKGSIDMDRNGRAVKRHGKAPDTQSPAARQDPSNLASDANPQGTEDADDDADDDHRADPGGVGAASDKTEIDYDIEIPMPDGENPIRLGDMKDTITSYRRRELSIEKAEVQMMDDRRMINEILNSGGQVTPEAVERIENRRTQHVAEQQALLLDQIPEWKDPAVRTAETAEIIETLSPWFTAQELANTDQAKVVKFARFVTGLIKRVERSENGLKDRVEQASTNKRKAAGQQKAKTRAGSQDKLAGLLSAPKEQIDWNAVDKLTNI